MGWRDVAAGGASGRRPRALPGRWISGAVVGVLWWWAALRLVVWPQSAGVVEGVVALGGWGLSLLPVHCVPRADGDGGWRRAAVRTLRGVRAARGLCGAVLTRAWRRRRSGGGSGRS